MRVAHVMAYFAPAYRYGGPPRTVHALCGALTDAGVSVDVFTTTANGDVELSAADRAGFSAAYPIHYFPRVGPPRLFWAPALRHALRNAVRGFDLVHIHGLWNATVVAAARIARSANVPYVVTPRGMLEAGAMAQGPWRKALLYKAVQRQDLAGAAMLHATSAGEASTIAALDLGPPIAFVPNGVDVREAARQRGTIARARLNLADDAPLIVFLGRLHPIKRLDLLAAAFAQVRAGRPDAHLVIAGPDEGGLRTTVEGWLGAHAARTTFTGHLGADETQALLDATDVLVQCSDSESFGMSVAEALAAGVPVVATDTCPWEIVDREACGFWVPQNADAIARAIIAIVNDRAAAARMGARARELVRREFSWPVVASRLAIEYERIVSGGSRAVLVEPSERRLSHG
jgi:glycosyltransferase involved in cell wall biosynthesis